MTFSSQVKNEIIHNQNRLGCCSAAHLYGILLFAKVFSISRILVTTENYDIIDHVQQALLDNGIKQELIQMRHTARSNAIEITDARALEQIVTDFGYLGNEPNIRVLRQNLLCDQCFGAFLSGCFLTGGNITDPEKGYHMEFQTHRKLLFDDMIGLLTDCEMPPLTANRNYTKLLYYKNSGQIEDMLTLMGAANSSLQLMNTKIYREIINDVNRRTNCESANIDKMVQSARRDRQLIQQIESKMGKNYLHDDLNRVAQLRVRYPELPIEDLGAMLDPPLSKSGISHRLRKIRAIAADLEVQHEH